MIDHAVSQNQVFEQYLITGSREDGARLATKTPTAVSPSSSRVKALDLSSMEASALRDVKGMGGGGSTTHLLLARVSGHVWADRM